LVTGNIKLSTYWRLSGLVTDAKTMPGVTAPFENIFDPADLLARAASSPRPIRELNRWRESEIVHGRVAMLASLGFVVQEQLQDYALFYNFDGKITGNTLKPLNYDLL